MFTYTRAPWLLVPLVAILLVPFMTYAASVLWNKDLGSKSYKWPNKFNKGEYVYLKLNNIEVKVSYNVYVENQETGELLSQNATVPYGTKLAFRFVQHKNTDIYWFAKGSTYDTPYGSWINGAGKPNDLCSNNKNRVAGPVGKNNLSGYAYYSVQQPSKQPVSGLGGVSCANASNDGLDCTMDKPGTYTVNFDFNPALGKFWAGVTRGSGSCNQSDSDSENVPSQRIQYTITVDPDPIQNNPPSFPTLAPTPPGLGVGGSCVVGEPFSINMTSTDPDGDTVRYGIDWDADGSIDQFVPTSGYVSSGTTQTASRAYSIAGDKTVKVSAQDDQGTSSGWSTLTFSCSEQETQCSDGIDNDGDGFVDLLDSDCTDGTDTSEFSAPPPPPPTPPLPGPGPADLSIRAIPSLVRRDAATKVTWTATNVASCIVNGDNGDSWSGISSPVGGQPSTPITKRTVFTLACIDLDGNPLSKSVTVNILPSWKEI